MKKLILIAGLLLVASNGWAEEVNPISDPGWYRVSIGQDPIMLEHKGIKMWSGNYVSADSIEMSDNGFVYAWTKVLFDFGDPTVDSLLTYYQIQCDSPKKLRILEGIWRGKDGKMVEKFDVTGVNGDWMYGNPESVVETQIKFLCDYIEADSETKNDYLCCLSILEDAENTIGIPNLGEYEVRWKCPENLLNASKKKIC